MHFISCNSQLAKWKKWFTLIELVIVMAIIGILSVILLKTYTWITQMTFRVQQTKNVHQEALHLAQVMQNFADNNAIDFSAYTWLATTQWIVDALYLKGKDGTLSFYMTGDCASPVISGNLVLTWKCWIEMVQSWEVIPLTEINRVNIRNLAFKIIPFASSDDYLQKDVPCPNNDYLHCVQKPGFWLLLDAYGINYGTQWTNRVHIPLQLFF